MLRARPPVPEAGPRFARPSDFHTSPIGFVLRTSAPQPRRSRAGGRSRSQSSASSASSQEVPPPSGSN